MPSVVDLSDLADEAQGVAKIVLESLQELLLRLALQMARDDYEDRRERQRQGIELAKEVGKYRGRRADPKLHAQVIALPCGSASISNTRAPVRARQAARLTLRVVLPTPPFWFKTPNIMFSSFAIL